MKKEYQTYKGYGIECRKRQYIAKCYANPTFYGNNIAKIKIAINQYLRGENYNDYNETYKID